MMINNAGDVFKTSHQYKKKTKASQSLKIKAEASVNMWVIFHNNDILKDLYKFLM